jgi:thiol-disulfide isomerase/thioredoxin/uncharacterized membrane protein YphA (DoxX/SURF4 family)
VGTVADLARAALAVVFAVSGVAKLLDLRTARQTMAAFGLPPLAARSFGTLLPFAELATAVALVITPSGRWGGLAALGLLLVFGAGIVNSLARGRKPDCNCFGQLSASPIGWRTLARNALLSALALIVVVDGPGSSLLAWSGEATAETIAILAVLALVGAAIAGWGLWRARREAEGTIARLERQLATLPPGLPIGLRAPGFELPDTRGESVTLASLCGRGRPVLLLFMSPGCGPCIRLMPEIARWHAAFGDRVTFALISNGGPDREQLAEQYAAAGDVTVLVQEGEEVADTYRVVATPKAVVVGPDGRVATPSAGGLGGIEALVRLTLQRAGAGGPQAQLTMPDPVTNPRQQQRPLTASG